MKQVLIFTRMKRDADRVARQLQKDGLPATAIHSDRSQAERTLALDEFKQGKSAILVATDIAARGLDIDSLPFVINYELPHTPEDYVHRIGRTGRAGTPGEAISLVSPEEMEFLVRVEKLLKRDIPRVATPQLEGGSRERTSERSAERGNERERPVRRPPREERDSNRPTPRSHHAKAPASPPSRVPVSNLPHFDFSKPYEPAIKQSTAVATPVPASAHRRQAKRSTGALLGGKRHDKSGE
jgi:ATP-dependent RNA helicase RhlE